jgi:leucyl aminopeptidase (aminopeptidase T)
MEKYSELAFNIVNNLLKIKSDDVISISGEIHNGKNANDPLVELPLIEELSVAIRKRKAFPVLEISTENLKRRFFAEMPDEVFSVPPNYYKSWINSIDKFIEISWESYSSDFRSVSEKQLQQFKDSTKSILQYLFDQKKKLIFLNFPTHELAKYIKSDYDSLLNSYLNAVGCNYNLLKIYGEEHQEQFFSYSNYIIASHSEILKLKIDREKMELYVGDITKHQIIVIPTGIIEFPIKRESLNGVFFAEKIYYKEKTYNNVKLKFEDGTVRYVAFMEDKKGNFHLQNELINSHKECYITIGFNKSINSYTNYFSYDRCIDGNISIKFIDRQFHPLFISNMNSEIRKRL